MAMSLEDMNFLYSRLITSNNVEDMYKTSILFGSGEGCVQPDTEKATALLTKAAELGYQPAIDLYKSFVARRKAGN